jgi:acyl carrier protein
MDYIEEKIQKIIAEQLGVKPTEIISKAKLVDDLGADSLDSVELVMAIEEAFGFEMPDEDVEQIRTVQDLVDYVQKKIGKSD